MNIKVSIFLRTKKIENINLLSVISIKTVMAESSDQKINNDLQNLKIEKNMSFEDTPVIGTECQYMFPTDAHENELTYSSKLVPTISLCQCIPIH